MKTDPSTSAVSSMKPTFITAAAMIGGLLLAGTFASGCISAKVTGEEQLGDLPTNAPAVVYVQDFDLGPEDVESKKGILSDVPVVDKVANETLYGQKPPVVQARELKELMATCLVQDLEKSGYVARRLDVANAMPTNGWLVRGVFTEVQEGNRLRRAMIGFGAGRTDLQVVTKFNDLTEGPPKPFYEVDTDARSRRLPGAGPTVILSPYPAVARFVLEGSDMNRSVRRTATKITQALREEMD